VLGAVTTSTALWVAGALVSFLPNSARAGLSLTAACLAVLIDLKIIHVRLPRGAWQVPTSIFGNGIGPAAVKFGVVLGLGFATQLPTTAAYAVGLTLVLLARDLPLALLAGLGFGLTRAMIPAQRIIAPEAQAFDQAQVGWSRFIGLSSDFAVVVIIGLLGWITVGGA
jgi:hypothetical protein